MIDLIDRNKLDIPKTWITLTVCLDFIRRLKEAPSLKPAEYIYCATDDDGKIYTMRGSSQKTRYYKTDKYLKGMVESANTIHGKKLHVQKFALIPVEKDK